MTFHLTACNRTPEVTVTEVFLEWQGHQFTFQTGAKYLQNNGGKGSLVVYTNSNEKVGGFFDLVNYLQKEGRIRL